MEGNLKSYMPLIHKGFYLITQLKAKESLIQPDSQDIHGLLFIHDRQFKIRVLSSDKSHYPTVHPLTCINIGKQGAEINLASTFIHATNFVQSGRIQ